MFCYSLGPYLFGEVFAAYSSKRFWLRKRLYSLKRFQAVAQQACAAVQQSTWGMCLGAFSSMLCVMQTLLCGL